MSEGPFHKSASSASTLAPSLVRLLGLGGVAWLIPMGVQAQPAEDLSGATLTADPAAQYAACLDLAGRDPTAALVRADDWERSGGGNGARHCAALAHLEAGDPAEAGRRLDALASDVAPGDADLAAQIWQQAAEAWLAAGAPWQALDAADLAVSATPADPALYVSRAYARMGVDDPAGALADLETAATLVPDDPTVMFLRAAALRRLSRYGEALALLDALVDAWPDDPEILLERGNARRLSGDAAGAQADWEAVLAHTDAGPLAAAAQANLDRLGVSDP